MKIRDYPLAVLIQDFMDQARCRRKNNQVKAYKIFAVLRKVLTTDEIYEIRECWNEYTDVNGDFFARNFDSAIKKIKQKYTSLSQRVDFDKRW